MDIVFTVTLIVGILCFVCDLIVVIYEKKALKKEKKEKEND